MILFILPSLAKEKFFLYKNDHLLEECHSEQSALNAIDRDIKKTREDRDKYGWQEWEAGVDRQAVYQIRQVYVEKYCKKYHGKKKEEE